MYVASATNSVSNFMILVSRMILCMQTFMVLKLSMKAAPKNLYGCDSYS